MPDVVRFLAHEVDAMPSYILHIVEPIGQAGTLRVSLTTQSSSMSSMSNTVAVLSPFRNGAIEGFHWRGTECLGLQRPPSNDASGTAPQRNTRSYSSTFYAKHTTLLASFCTKLANSETTAVVKFTI